MTASIPGMGGAGIFLFATVSTKAWVHPVFYAMGAEGALSPEIKWAGCEADHSTPLSVEVKNALPYISSWHGV
jgi:hypothetical protein